MTFGNEFEEIGLSSYTFLESQCLNIYLIGCNVLNIWDILMLKKENEAPDEYILIMSTKLTFSADTCIKNVSTVVSHKGKRVNNLLTQ